MAGSPPRVAGGQPRPAFPSPAISPPLPPTTVRPSESLVSPEAEEILEKRCVAVATAEPATQSHILSRAMRDIYMESRHLQARGAIKAYQQAEEEALKEKQRVNSSAATGMGDEIRGGTRNDEVTLPKVPDTQRTRRELRRTAMPKWAQNQLQDPDAPPPVFSANRQLNRSGENSLNSSFALLDAVPGGAAASPADPFEKSVSGGTQAAPILAEAKIRRVSRNSTPSSVEDPRSPRPAASLPSPNVPWQHNKQRLQTAAESPVLVVGDVSDVGAVAAPLARRQREHRQKKADLVAARERRMSHRPHCEQPSRFADSLSSVEAVEGRTEKSDCQASAASVAHSSKKEAQSAARARSKETKQKANASTSKKKTAAEKDTAQRANQCTSVDTSLASPHESTTTAPYQGDRELLKSVAAAICDFFTADDNNNSGRTTTATVADPRQVIAAMPPTRLEELFSLYQAHQVLCNRLHITSKDEGLGPERYEAIQQWTTSVQPVVPPPPPPPPLTNARAAATASGVPAALSTPPALQEQQPLQLTASQRRAVLLQRTPKQSSKANGAARLDGTLTGATTAAGGGIAKAATEPLSPSPKAAHKSGNGSQRATRASATAAVPNAAASALPPLASPLKAGARDTHAPAAAAAAAVADTGPPPPAKQRGFVRLFSCSAPSTHNGLADKGEKRRKNAAVVPLHDGRAVPAARAAPPPPLSSSEFVPHCGLEYNCDEAVQLYALWERKEAQKLQQEIQRAKVKDAAATTTATTKAPAPDTLLQESFNLLVRGHPSNRSLNSLALPGSSGSMSKTVLDLLHRTYGSSSSLSDTGLGQHSSFSLSIAERDISVESQMSSSLSQPLPPLTRGLSQGYLLFNSDSTSASHEESAKEKERVERRSGQPTLQERDVAEIGRVRAAPRAVSAASTPARGGSQGAVGSEASSADLFSDYFEASPSGSDAGSLQSSFTFYSRRDDSSSHHSDSSSVAAVEAMGHLYTMPTEVSWRKKA